MNPTPEAGNTATTQTLAATARRISSLRDRARTEWG